MRIVPRAITCIGDHIQNFSLRRREEATVYSSRSRFRQTNYIIRQSPTQPISSMEPLDRRESSNANAMSMLIGFESKWVYLPRDQTLGIEIIGLRAYQFCTAINGGVEYHGSQKRWALSLPRESENSPNDDCSKSLWHCCTAGFP